MRLCFSTFLPVLMATFCAAVAAQEQDSTPDGAADSSLVSKLRLEAVAYEHGEGVPRNPVLAATLYCKGARLGDAQAQYNLGWMYANGRGVERSDRLAAFFFHLAAEQGLEAAQRMLKVVGLPDAEVPDCVRDPAPPPAAPRTTEAAQPSVDYRAIAPRKIFELVMKMAPQVSGGAAAGAGNHCRRIQLQQSGTVTKKRPGADATHPADQRTLQCEKSL